MHRWLGAALHNTEAPAKKITLVTRAGAPRDHPQEFQPHPAWEITVNEERVWQVRLPDGSAWIPADARPDDPRASWIYAKSTAEMFARTVGGTVIEVTARHKKSLLDQEIAAVLAQPAKQKAKTVKLRTRPFGQAARRAIAIAILESVPLSYPARAAIDTARETADNNTYKRALQTLQAGLPDELWVGYDRRLKRGFAQTTAPVWISDDPQGEDPTQWQEIGREMIAQILLS